MQASQIPNFTKRHYDYLAEDMRSKKERLPPSPEAVEKWVVQVLNLATILKRDNPRFVFVRFMQACGMTRGEAHRALEGQDL